MELTEDNKKGWKCITLTTIKEADDGTNNYTEFKQKSTLELDAASYWKFVDSPNYNSPNIPELRTTQEIQGVNATGVNVMVSIPGNEQEVIAAREKSKVWLDGDKKALAIIVKAVPIEKLYVVRDCTSAHAAWKALKNEYEPANTLAALTIMQQIVGNVCHPTNDPVLWLQTMIQLYGQLQDADPTMLTDGEFAKHLIMLMMQDNTRWRYFRDDLRKRLQVAEAAGWPISSQIIIQHLKDEEVELGNTPSVTTINAIIAAGKGRARYEQPAVPGAYYANTEFAGNAAASLSHKPQ